MRRLAALIALLMFASAAPAAADKGHVDLMVTATLDNVAYLATDVVQMRIAVLNAGTAPATGVVVRSAGDLAFEPSSWSGLLESGPGVSLAPGEQVVVVATATPHDTGNGMTQRVEAVSFEPDDNPADNRAELEAFVTAEKCDLTITLHTDTDGDGVFDPGETKRGAEVRMSGGRVPGSVQARTNERGIASFPGIQGGEYSVSVNLPPEWVVDPDIRIRLRPGQNEIVVRARHVDTSKLAASVSFDRATYSVGDTVRERITLTNNGATDLTGLIAHCGSYSVQTEPTNELQSLGWDDLDPTGPGATLRAGETRTWEFTDVIAPRMWDYGFVVLQCDFLVAGMLEGAYAMARASVPGGRGSFGGSLVLDQQPVAGIEILLIEPVSGKTVGRTVTDAEGHFAFPEVPAGEYRLLPLGPWNLTDRNLVVQVLAGEHVEYLFLSVERGPVQRDPDEPPRADPVPPPAPQASPAPHPSRLADTGADVTELIALGFLLVVTGMLLMRRRPVS